MIAAINALKPMLKAPQSDDQKTAASDANDEAAN
jgi:hypothetical protein